MVKRRDTRPDDITREAVDWFVRRDNGAMAAADEDAFQAWLRADDAHQRAYAEAIRLWRDFETVPRTALEAGRSGSLRRPGSRRSGLRRAAMTVMAAAAMAVFIFGFDVPMRVQADAYSGIGEVAKMTLPDGSVAMLAPDSAIALDYSAAARRVRLLRGKAAFDVAPHTGRPFDVVAQNGRARALGTAFIVGRGESGAVVTVLESRVRVSYPADRRDGVTVRPGQRIRYDSEKGLGTLETVDTAVEAAWMRGKLIFTDRSLGSVIGELNHYYAGHIHIIDDSIRHRRVNGVFEMNDPLAVVNSLERSLGLRSTRLTDLVILLHD